MRGEGGASRDALAPAIVLFAIMVAHTLLETARDALFLARLGPQHLAWVYIAMAAIALLAFVALRRWAQIRDPRWILIACLGLATVGTAGFAAVVARSSVAVFALYVWTGLIATLIVPCFWTLLDRGMRVDQAKRAFATIGAGGVIGAIVGSGFAAILGRLLAASDLVIAGALAYAAATACAVVLAPRRVVDEVRAHVRRTETLSRATRRYIGLLVGFGVLTTIALTLGDLVFKRAIAQRLGAADLASAFGAIYAGLNTLALAIQLLVTRRLLVKWGVGSALAVLPAILATAGFGFAIGGAVVAVLIAKLGDGGLRHSLHRVTCELLYMPVPSAIRDRLKPIADAAALRGGEALAALASFGLGVTGVDTRVLAAIAAGTATLWLIVVPFIHRRYIGQFGDVLRAGEAEHNAHVPELDGDTAELLVESLSNPDEAIALPALELLAGRARIPALVLYHRSPAVVLRALELLEGASRSDVDHALGHLLEHADLRIRAAALAATAGSVAYRERRIAALADPDLRIRAAAVVGLVDDPEYGDTATAEVAHLLTRGTSDRLAVANAIAHAPDQRLRSVVYQLLAWHEPEVATAAVRMLARDPDRVELGRLTGLLAQPQTRGAVRALFLRAGSRGLDHLVAALADPRTPLAVRQHLPRTISRFGSRRAAAALVDRLAREPDHTTLHKLLRALGRMRESEPGLRIDEHAVHAHARREIGEAARYAVLGAALRELAHEPTASVELLIELLAEEYSDALEHVFRALGILRPRDGLRSVHDALIAGEEARRSAAREILEASAPADVRVPLFALLDAGSTSELVERLGPLAPGPFTSHERLLVALLADPNEAVRCFAAYHAAEHHLAAMRPELERLRAAEMPPFVQQAFDQAIARLDARS